METDDVSQDPNAPAVAAAPPRPRAHASDLTTELPAFLSGQIDVQDGPDELGPDDLEVVDALKDLGLSTDEARRAVAEDRVALALSQQALDDPPRYTLERLARKSGVDQETLRSVRSAMGLPVQERYGRQDLEWARQLSDLLEAVSTESVLRSARSRGQALMQVVRTDMSTIRDELVLPLRQAGADDLTVGIALAEATRVLTPTVRELLVSTYGLLLRHQMGTELSAMATRTGKSSMVMAVGFVDLVGYTKLSAAVDPDGLDVIIDAFESRVVEVVSRDPDVGIVKYLGDAAMLVGADGPRLARAMVELCTEVPELADAPVRGGMAVGEVIAREGDFWGTPVNTAARLTDITRPWKVLVAEQDVRPLREHYRIDRIRPVRLRGLGIVRPGVILGEAAPTQDSALAGQVELTGNGAVLGDIEGLEGDVEERA